ncbi:hypothetical protein BC332_15143 [Capsicum chinense]|nr:hypothetical protein BC332_15143 [Capsicum chinense]
MNYYDADAGNKLATQDASTKTDEVTDMEMTLINTIKGFSLRAGQPWHLVDEKLWCICSCICRVSERGLDIPPSKINAHYHRLRYASLLCKYGSIKANNGYFSENDDPPRPRMKFTPKETDRVLRIQ